MLNDHVDFESLLHSTTRPFPLPPMKRSCLPNELLFFLSHHVFF